MTAAPPNAPDLVVQMRNVLPAAHESVQRAECIALSERDTVRVLELLESPPKPAPALMEIDVDDVPWKDDLVTRTPEIEDGCLKLPPGPGWGTELDEEAIRAHPPRRPH